ncbi:long-chain-fatty-acid--CoA ligase [Sporosarcina sp. 179-K 8C2 HS]|uniref:class I adenylate-forming enzyme family protein n=1 Tax=Sporosarcina sp. 179-K 8C2 HS TaxID=3142387 RepID=UPI0039A3C7A8
MLTMGNMIRQNASKLKDKTAVIFQGKTFSYKQLNERANRLANAFKARGYEKGDKVAVLMKNNAAYVDIIVGLSKIGVVIVPMNYRLVGREIEYILQNSDSRGLILSSEYEKELDSIQSVAELDTILVVGGTSQAERLDYESFLLSGSEEEPVAEVNELDTFYMGYTSGTTGKPKGVVISQRSRMLTGMAAAIEYKIDESDVHLCAGPIYHAAPWIFLVMQLIVGGTVVIHETFNAEQVLADIEENRITNAFLAPTMYSFITNVKEDVRMKYDLSSIRVLISAGSPLATKSKEDILAFFPRVELHEFYGSTESAITLNIKPKDIENKERSVGLPFPLVDCIILDENKQRVKQGEIGELYFKGPYLLDEYYKNPDDTKASSYEGYFSVGDMAMQDEEGFYYIVDRKKDMLISGGVNIYPRDIEEVLYTHPDIMDVAVIGVPHPVWGEAVEAIVVPREGKTLTEQDVIEFCEGKMAGYKKPKSVSFLTELPRNPSGKILKTSLRDQYWKHETTKI